MKKENLLIMSALTIVLLVVIVIMSNSNDGSLSMTGYEEGAEVEEGDLSTTDLLDTDSDNGGTNGDGLDPTATTTEDDTSGDSSSDTTDDETSEDRGGLMFSTGNTVSGAIFEGDCVATSCNSACLSLNFEEGKCFDDSCFCLDTMIDYACDAAECSASCPTGVGFCSRDTGCSCQGDVDTILCRSFGNAQTKELGLFVYYKDSDTYEIKRDNDCANEYPSDDTLNKPICNYNQKDLEIIIEDDIVIAHTMPFLENIFISYGSTECGVITCDNTFKKGVCSVNQCVCNYYVDKAFIQEAINRYLIDPTTAINEADISVLIDAYASEFDGTVDETDLENAIIIVNNEINNADNLQINYDLLY